MYHFLVQESSEQHLLFEYSEYTPEGCSEGEVPGLYQHNTNKNDFIYKVLPDWDCDEGENSYEDWKEGQLLWISHLTGLTLTSMDELKEGDYWTVFHLH